MKNLRNTIQLTVVIIAFVTFKRTENIALKLALFMVLSAIIIQEFLHIYNSEKDRNEDEFKNDKYRYFRLAGLVVLELFVIATVYYLSIIMIDALRILPAK